MVVVGEDPKLAVGVQGDESMQPAVDLLGGDKVTDGSRRGRCFLANGPVHLEHVFRKV